MAKLFLGLAIAVMLAAAVLGFLTKGNIDKLQSVLKETKGTLSRTESNLKKTETELKKTQEDLTSANSTIEQRTTENNTLKGKNDELDKALASTKAELESKTAALAKATEDLAKISVRPGVDIDQMVKDFEQQKNDLNKAQAELSEKNAMVDSLNASNRQKDEQLGVAQSEVKRYQTGIARNGLTGRILAVNPGWNFVVLSVGDKQGATAGSLMVVTRGGEPIGRARITSVEPSTSIADLLPGTFRRGVSVQPGDTVVYEGSRAKPLTPAPAGGVSAGAPLPQN